MKRIHTKAFSNREEIAYSGHQSIFKKEPFDDADDTNDTEYKIIIIFQRTSFVPLYYSSNSQYLAYIDIIRYLYDFPFR